METTRHVFTDYAITERDSVRDLAITYRVDGPGGFVTCKFFFERGQLHYSEHGLHPIAYGDPERVEVEVVRPDRFDSTQVHSLQDFENVGLFKSTYIIEGYRALWAELERYYRRQFSALASR